MARGRAFRRFRQALKKKRAAGFYSSFMPFWRGKVTPKMVGRRANSPKACSCRMCGNPRRHYGDLTRQELVAAYDWQS